MLRCPKLARYAAIEASLDLGTFLCREKVDELPHGRLQAIDVVGL